MSRPSRFLVDPRTIALASTGVALFALIRSSKRRDATVPAPAVTIAAVTPPQTRRPTGSWSQVLAVFAGAAIVALFLVGIGPVGPVESITDQLVLRLVALGGLAALVATVMMARAHGHDDAEMVALDRAGKLAAVGSAALVFWAGVLALAIPKEFWAAYPPVALVALVVLVATLAIRRWLRRRREKGRTRRRRAAA
ncbi:hypothetical protein [Microbacterium sp. S16(2024)]|uniref:hypothetical protein n=1 Tax=Microbacterium sp. S16(2024) TaxID=3368601 RepID=UPI00373EE127